MIENVKGTKSPSHSCAQPILSPLFLKRASLSSFLRIFSGIWACGMKQASSEQDSSTYGRDKTTTDTYLGHPHLSLKKKKYPIQWQQGS